MSFPHFVVLTIMLTLLVSISTGSLSALVYQHSITPISLPCALRIPDKGELRLLTNARYGY